MLNQLIEEIILKRKIGVLYQPIIDLELKNVMAYEAYSVIETTQNINITKFLRYTQDSNRYDKIQQTLFINALDSFERIQTKESPKIFANIDLTSYENYINKPRLYDLMAKLTVTVELHNYEKYDLTTLQQKILAIREKGAKVAIDHFGSGIMDIDDLKLLTLDYLKTDISLVNNIENDLSKQKYLTDLSTLCTAKEILLVVVGVETKEQYDTIKKLGIRYVQGYYFARPTFAIDIINNKINSLLSRREDDLIL
ncbi:putative membrane protein YjcC [compost metagenome]